MNDLIGVFDSGLGGISVLHKARTLLPNEHFLFYGDNANAPYGIKAPSEIARLCENAIDKLLQRDVKAILIACNTATSVYAQTLREKLTLPVVGIEPAIKPAQCARHGGFIPVIATKATLSLPKFEALMGLYGDHVIPVIGEGLVELVESGEDSGDKAEKALKNIFAPFEGKQVDSIVLGCTHYPFLVPVIRRFYPDIPIFDGRDGTVLQLKRLLSEGNLLSKDSCGSVEFSTSGTEDDIRRMRALMERLDYQET